MRYLGGHLGVTVSALVDGQLDPPSAERAWAHVHGCPICRRQVEREGWVKTQLAAMTGEEGLPPQLLGSLYGLGSAPADRGSDPAAAWAAVEAIERQGRGRRRTGLALAGAGSVSVAVLGLATLTGSPLGIGGGTTTSPSQAPASLIAPVARAHGRLPLGQLQDQPHTKDRSRGHGGAEGRDDLQR
jgi:anti-sigma factor RsiW